MDLKRVFDSVAERMRSDFQEASSQIRHSPSKGRVREAEVVQSFLKPYMPRFIGIGNGEIIAASGAVSPECDIVLFESRGCPTLYEKAGFQVFPAECVYAVMEVKSNLDTRGLEDAFNKITAIKQLPKTAIVPQAGIIRYSTTLYGKEWDVCPTIGVVFAFDSIHLTTLRARLDELNHAASTHERIDFVTVLNAGMLLNWDDSDSTVNPTPTAKTRLRAWASKNPLMLTTIFLQQLLQGAHPPELRIQDYLPQATVGHFLE